MAGIPKTPRSGGPRTDEGRVASSRNALKSGVYSAMVVIPGESEDDFRQMYDQFVADFFPRDIAEGAMVHDLAVLTWKRLRLERLEQASFVRSLTKRIQCFEIRIDNTVDVDESHEWLINDLGRLTDSYIADHKRHLAYLEPLSAEGISKDTFYELPSEQPSLYRYIVELAVQYHSLDVEPTPEEIAVTTITTEDYGREGFVRFALRRAREDAEQVCWVARQLPAIKSAVTDLKEKRLLELMKSQGVMRVHDDLSRAFYRTLSELRRQQTWRQKIGAIDVTPTQIPE
jgi:hypothetical protein